MLLYSFFSLLLYSVVLHTILFLLCSTLLFALLTIRCFSQSPQLWMLSSETWVNYWAERKRERRNEIKVERKSERDLSGKIEHGWRTVYLLLFPWQLKAVFLLSTCKGMCVCEKVCELTSNERMCVCVEGRVKHCWPVKLKLEQCSCF